MMFNKSKDFVKVKTSKGELYLSKVNICTFIKSGKDISGKDITAVELSNGKSLEVHLSETELLKVLK